MTVMTVKCRSNVFAVRLLLNVRRIQCWCSL